MHTHVCTQTYKHKQHVVSIYTVQRQKIKINPLKSKSTLMNEMGCQYGGGRKKERKNIRNMESLLTNYYI